MTKPQIPNPPSIQTDLDVLDGAWDDGMAPAEAAVHRNEARAAHLLVTFVCVALVALNISLVLLTRSHEVGQQTKANENLAGSIAQHVDSTLLDAEHVLDDMVFEMEQAELDPSLAERLQPALVNRVARVEQLAGLFVYDAAGRAVVTSDPVPDETHSPERPYFLFHRDNPSREVNIGLPIRSQTDGGWVIPLSRRLQDAHGRFAGVALATLQLGYFKRILDRFDLGEQGAVALALHDHLVVRLPFQDNDVGRNLQNQPIFKMAARQVAGSSTERSVIDHVVRIISFNHALNYPVVAVVAVGQEEVLASWRKRSVILTMVVLGLCVLVIIAGRFLIGSVHRRAAAEMRLSLARDALANANERLAQMAREDGLTGIPNRRFFDMRLVKLFGHAQRHQRPLAVVMVDVDEFKKFNDHYGHVAGDECLRRVAKTMLSGVRRPEDLLARYGGEEMALLLPDTDVEGAHQVAEAARLAVAALAIPHENGSQGIVTVSLGVAAAVPAAHDLPSSLVSLADSALYEAKATGRNRVVRATS